MLFHEFGSRENKKIILIHGSNIPWQMWTPQIEYFSKKYFVIVPALDGHIEDDNSVFSSVQRAAQEIEEYYTGQYGKEIFAVCGMSMGGTIAGILWANGILRIKKLIFESAPLVPMSPLLISINTSQNLSLTHKVQQHDKNTVCMFEKIYPKSLLPYVLKMIETMDDQTVINCISSFGKYHLPENLEGTGMDIVFFHGTVFMEIMAKKSAKYLKKVYPQIEVKSFQGYNHCELSVNHPEQYIEEVEKVFSKD